MSHETLIRVHGTFAALPEDRGSAWWQLPGAEDGHPFWSQVVERLPPGIQVDEAVFHWSGVNSECDRQVAAAALLERIEKLEQNRAAYHLVGHSHGGSVLWATLCLACERRVDLPGLRSWTTVGTPFLCFRRLRISGLMIAGVAAVVLFAVAGFVSASFREGVGDFLIGLWRHCQHIVAVNGWMAVGFAALCILVPAGYVTRWAFRRVSLRRGRFEREAARKYGSKWLGLRSEEDEAVNSLKSVNVTTLPVPRWKAPGPAAPFHAMVSQTPGFVASRSEAQPAPRSDDQTLREGLIALGLILAAVLAFPFLPDDFRKPLFDAAARFGPWFLLMVMALVVLALRYFYNRVAAPLMDRALNTRLSDWALGNDTKSFRAVHVSTCPPVAGPGAECPPLPAEIDAELIDEANQRIASLVPSLRRLLLYQAALKAPTILENAALAGIEQSGKELVHMSYFNHPGVLDIVSAHILSRSETTGPTERKIDGATLTWIEDFKNEVPAVFS